MSLYSREEMSNLARSAPAIREAMRLIAWRLDKAAEL